MNPILKVLWPKPKAKAKSKKKKEGKKDGKR